MNRHQLRAHPLILPYYLPEFILAISWGLLAPVLPLYATGFGSTYSVVGVLLAGEAIGMLLGDVPAGLLMRRLGPKPTMLLGALGAILATTALFWTQGVGLAIVLRVVSGFARALYTVARHAYMSIAARSGARGRAFALSGGLMRVGRFIGPAAGGLLAESLGLRSAFLGFGGLGALALGAMALYVPEKGWSPPPAGAAKPIGLLWSTVRENYRVLLSAGAGQVFAQMIRAGRSAIIPLYAADVLGLDVTAIGLLVSLSSAVDMALFYPAGWIMDRFGRKVAIVPSFILQGIGMALTPLTGGFAGLLAVSSLMGVGNGLSSGSMMTLGADLAPERTRGEFLGVWRLIGDGGQTLGPVLVGTVSQALALPAAALVLALAGVGAGLVFAWGVPESLQRRGKASAT